MAQLDRREALRQAIALEHLLYTQATKHDDLAARWQQRAALALRQGEESLAREALARQAAEQRRAAGYRAQYLQQTLAIRRAKRTLPPTPRSTPPAASEQRLNQLALEDRLNRDLAALKAQLANKR
jgi:phage shock protein A